MWHTHDSTTPHHIKLLLNLSFTEQTSLARNVNLKVGVVGKRPLSEQAARRLRGGVDEHGRGLVESSGAHQFDKSLGVLGVEWIGKVQKVNATETANESSRVDRFCGNAASVKELHHVASRNANGGHRVDELAVSEPLECLGRAIILNGKSAVGVGAFALAHSSTERVEGMVETKWTGFVLAETQTSMVWLILLVLES